MKGNGTKLIKMHLLHHFTTMIHYLVVQKIDTFILEKNHKIKVKNMLGEQDISPSILNTGQQERITKIVFCSLQNAKYCPLTQTVSFIS